MTNNLHPRDPLFMTTFKPMLAAKTPPETYSFRFPVLVSPKIDGVRAMVIDGRVMSRSLKPIPNEYVQKLFGHPALNGLDGELVVGSPVGQDVMQRTTSGVMRREGEPAVTFHVFDMCDRPEQPFESRLVGAHSFAAAFHELPIVNVPHYTVGCDGDLKLAEAEYLAAGYEGAMVRDPKGLYKHGRSTAKEGGLIKLKRFADGEAWVVGFEERMHNDNEATVSELGRTKRSSHKENLVGRGDLGALVCHLLDPEGARVKVLDAKGMYVNVEFNIGTGFTDADRAALWAKRAELIGSIVKFRSFTAAGVKDAPRFPVFVGFRDERDM